MRWFPRVAVSFWLLLFVAYSASADEYKFSVVPDKPLVTINEGVRGLEHYTFTNLGNDPIWIFTFSISRVGRILPDASDRAKPHYFGPDASSGIEVDSSGTFKFGYLLTTPRKDRRPENKGDPDFGLQTFLPNISLDLREGSEFSSHILPKRSGTIDAFDVKVVDAKTAKTPEPGTMSLAGIALAVLIGMGRGRLAR